MSIDIQRFDPELEKDLVTRIDVLDEQIEPLAAHLNAMHESKPLADEADGGEEGSDGWTTAETNKALTLGDRLRSFREERHQHQSRLDSIRMSKPRNLLPAELAKPSALERLLREGPNGVDGEEVKAQLEKVRETNFANTAPKAGTYTSWLIEDGVSDRQAFHINERRARMAIATNDPAGSAVVPPTTLPTIVDALASYSGALQICQIMDSTDGKQTKIPQIDATAQKGSYASENAPAAEQQTPDLGEVSIGSHSMNTGYIDITNEMIDDADIDIVAYVIKQLARRAGRAMNEKFTVGTGVNQPEGFLTKAKERTLTSNSSITFPRDIIRLIFDIDDAYIEGEQGIGGFPAGAGLPFNGSGKVAFTFNRSVEAAFLEATDNQGRPLWSPNIQTGKPDRLQGYQYVTNSDMPKVAGSAKVVAFGNFDYHVIRMVKKLAIHTFFDSATAINNRVRILGYARNDSKGVSKPYSTGTNNGKWPAIACLKMGT